MPKAIDADWPLIQTLYAQGLTPRRISEQTGVKTKTIQTRAERNGWRQLASKNKENVKDAAKLALESVSADIRKTLGLALKDHVSTLPKARSWKQAARINGELEPLVRNARTVFGWNDATSNPAVRINVLASAVRIEEGNPSNPQSILIPSAPQGEGEEGTP